MTIADRAGTQQITFLDTHYGLRLSRDQGTCRIYHVSGTAYLGFCQRPDAAAEPQGITLTFVTDRVDDWCAPLKREGVEFVKEPVDHPPYRIYNAFVRDPNGYLIEIQRFWEPLV